jgi:hypothetical protein
VYWLIPGALESTAAARGVSIRVLGVIGAAVDAARADACVATGAGELRVGTGSGAACTGGVGTEGGGNGVATWAGLGVALAGVGAFAACTWVLPMFSVIRGGSTCAGGGIEGREVVDKVLSVFFGLPRPLAPAVGAGEASAPASTLTFDFGNTPVV